MVIKGSLRAIRGNWAKYLQTICIIILFVKCFDNNDLFYPFPIENITAQMWKNNDNIQKNALFFLSKSRIFGDFILCFFGMGWSVGYPNMKVFDELYRLENSFSEINRI